MSEELQQKLRSQLWTVANYNPQIQMFDGF